jgi:hypothetical protein
VLDPLRQPRQFCHMNWKIILRGIAAMIIGYAVIVALTIFGFNVLLGGRPLYGGSPIILSAGAIVAVVSGLLGGFIAGRIGASRGPINAALVLVPLTIDTIGVLFFSKGSNAPFWFDAMASGTLMLCTLLGGVWSDRRRTPMGSARA